MPRKSRVKTVGLGWANRALSGKKSPVIIDENLIGIVNDLVASIRYACWVNPSTGAPNLRHPTLHMDIAVNAYLDWKRENNV